MHTFSLLSVKLLSFKSSFNLDTFEHKVGEIFLKILVYNS